MLFSFGLNEISNLFLFSVVVVIPIYFTVDMTLNENKRKNQNVMLNVICNAVDCTLFEIIPKPIRSIPSNLENSADFLATHAF